MKISPEIRDSLEKAYRGNPPRFFHYKTAWPLVIILFALAAVARRLPYGFSWEDEGFHLASPARYLLGDRPFVDEAFTVLRSFDLLSYFLMKVSPWDFVLLWRWVGFGIEVICLLWVGLLLARILPRYVALLTFGSLVLFSPYNLWVLNYGNLGMGVAVSGISLWLYSGTLESQLSRRVAAVTGGLIFSTCGFIFTPFIAIAVVPLLSLLLVRRYEGTKRLSNCTRFWLAGCTTGLLVMFSALYGFGLFGPFLNSLHELREIPNYSSNIFLSLFRKVVNSGFFPSILMTFVGLFSLNFIYNLSKSTAARWLLLSGTFASFFVILVLFMNDENIFRTNSQFLILFNLALMASALGRILSQRSFGEPGRMTALLLFASGTVCFWLLPMFSANDFSQVNVSLWLLWPGAVAILSLFDGHQAPEPGSVKSLLKVLPLLLMMTTLTYHHLYDWTFEDGPISTLNTKFSHPKLRGIYSTKQRVDEIESLLNNIQAKVQRGDFLLAYNGYCGELSALPYLTNTRPPLRSTILLYPKVIPSTLVERWISRMEKLDRIPMYAVILHGPHKGSGPLDDYVFSHYDHEENVGQFQIWKLKVLTQ